MARTLTIRIASMDQALEGFKDTFSAVAARRRVHVREGVYFTSLEAARALLTPSRLALLRAVRAHRPTSIYQLARTVHRDLKNVQEDLRILERYGLVRMSQGRGTGKRPTKVPEAPFAEIALKIAI